MRSAVKEREHLLKDAEAKIKTCQSKLNHLNDKINPWTDLAQTYEQLAEMPAYWSKEKKTEYQSKTNEKSTTARPRSFKMNMNASRELLKDESEVDLEQYFKEFNLLRDLKYRHQLSELGTEEIRNIESQIKGFNPLSNEAQLINIEETLIEYFKNQGEMEEDIKAVLETIRISLSAKK